MKNVCVALMLIGVLTGCANLKRHAASATAKILSSHKEAFLMWLRLM